MSALGQKQTFAMQSEMSAKGQKRTLRPLFDHLVRSTDYSMMGLEKETAPRRGHWEPQCPRRKGTVPGPTFFIEKFAALPFLI
jgi:hypothetical protein